MSMIALRGMDSITASAVLADAALQTGPHPDLSHQELHQKVIAEVIAEIRFRIGLNATDDTPEARIRLDEALSDELDAVGFADTNFEAVTASLGTQGELPTSAYHFIFPLGALRDLGENEKFVRRCVLEADEIQHFYTPTDNAAQMSLFGKKIGKGPRTHWIIIQARRDGIDLHCTSAWRILPSLIDLSTAQKPFDMLRAFALHYGLDLVIPGRTATKFIENVDVGTWSEWQRRLDVDPRSRIARPLGRSNHSSYHSIEVGHDLHGRAIVSMAYEIDVFRYLNDKRKYAL